MPDNTFTDALASQDTTNADVDAAKEGGLMDGDEVRFNARISANLRDASPDLCERKSGTMTRAVQRYTLRAVKEGTLNALLG